MIAVRGLAGRKAAPAPANTLHNAPQAERKELMFGGFHADELMHLIGYIIGPIILCAAGFLTGYIGINVLIGGWRWFSGVFL